MALPGEKTLIEPDKRGLVLTTHRVRLQATSSGSVDFGSILLENVASCAIRSRSRPIFLILASVLLVLMVLGGIGFRFGYAQVPLGEAVLFVLMVILYFATRTHQLEIASTGGVVLAVQVSGTGRQAIYDFVDQLESAKSQRYLHPQQVSHGSLSA